MSIKIANIILVVISPFILTGCLTVNSLLDESNNVLNSNQKIIAKDISNKIKTICVHYKYEPGSDRKLTGDMKFSSSIDVKKFEISDAGWYKVYFMSQGIWDYAYYNPSSFKFVCGEKQWNQFAESRKIEFQEVGAKVKSINNIQATQAKTSFSENKNVVEEKLKLLKSLREKDLITEKQYSDQVLKIISAD